MMRESFLGYPVDNLNMQEALDWIADSVVGRQSKLIAVTNANKLWQASRNAKLSEFLRQADLVIPEYAVVWGAGMLGISLHHTGGIMLLKAFLPFAEKGGIRPYFLGAKSDVVQEMVKKVKADHPGLQVAGFHHGYLREASVKEKVMADLTQCAPDVLFIAMGCPKQEYLMIELKGQFSIPVLMGVGGSFDVIAGKKQDAPSWARSTGLEWLYRISQDPLKIAYWKRYFITNTWFIWQIFKHIALRKRGQGVIKGHRN